MLAIVLAIVLAGCDGGASAVRAPKGAERAAAEAPVPSAVPPAGRGDPRQAPVRQVSGKPFWAANRTRTAEENAQRGFERNGAAFGAETVDDYVAAAHKFVNDPPRGVETLKRANGDTLIYDPKGNVFAVVSRDGAPRALFKPDDGVVYWDAQKAREARRATAAREREPSTSG
jgi:pyocin large subunit-like protein